MKIINPNEAYVNLISHIVNDGNTVTCRGFKTWEVLANQVVFSMSSPLITLTARKMGYRFACAEAAWIISGDNRLENIEPYSAMMKKFSDDGIFLAGAYGPKIVDQLPYVIKNLTGDQGSRQAVINIWRESPRPSRDIPCTLSVQFLLRDDVLHMIHTMRSSDAWLGVPYDVFSFSMLGLYMALILRLKLQRKITLGNITMNAGSRHLYTEGKFGYTVDDIHSILYSPLNKFNTNIDLDPPMINYYYRKPAELLRHLSDVANDKVPENSWLNGVLFHNHMKKRQKHLVENYKICQGEK